MSAGPNSQRDLSSYSVSRKQGHAKTHGHLIPSGISARSLELPDCPQSHTGQDSSISAMSLGQIYFSLSCHVGGDTQG